MTAAPVHGTRFRVTDASGDVVLGGRVPERSTGSWDVRSPAVYRLDLSRLQTPGRYRIATSGGVTALSPCFRARGAGYVRGRILRAGVVFDRNQRDGAQVVAGRLHRRSSHLLDRRALTCRWPRLQHGSDLILDRRLHHFGGSVDFSDGWFDAGDHLKFTHATAYNDVLLFTSARLLGHRAAPGRRIIPNLVGRVSAAFALATQHDADTYRESTWRDDMRLGAAEIALASHRVGQPAVRYLRGSACWARGFIAERGTVTLNLSDTGALAEPVEVFDENSHTFGLIATVALSDRLRFQGFASLQRTWLLGGDPWGVTAMVGIGHRFPICMQHQVADLSGSLHGSPPIDVGAVVNGPKGKNNFEGGLGGFQSGMRHCTAASRRLHCFHGHGSRYVDDVRVWQTGEPALDMTGAAVIAAAAQLRLHPHARLGR